MLDMHVCQALRQSNVDVGTIENVGQNFLLATSRLRETSDERHSDCVALSTQMFNIGLF